VQEILPDTPHAELQGTGVILVVDDEALQCEIAEKMLGSLGYTVSTVSSGEDALEYLREHSVDLVVLDMLMEPGINGRETYSEIIKLHPEQKAIIASGFSESDDVKATLQHGAGEFIKKPYSMEHIGKAVKKELAK